MAIPVISNKTPQIVQQYHSVIEMIDGIGQDGMLDIDSIYPQMKEAVRKAGKIQIAGIIFDENDIEKIYQRAMQYAQ